MHIDDHLNYEAEKLSTTSRISRIAFGVALVAFTMNHSGVLGALVALPLLAIYPILTGILGYGLVEQVFMQGRRVERPARITRAIRVSLVLLGIGLIGAVFSGATSQNWLALLGIYPILSGGLGLNLVGEAVATRRMLQRGAHRVHSMSDQTRSLSKTMRPTITADATTKMAA